MARTGKIFGFLVVAALLASACGDDAARPNDTSTNTSADSATADSTAEGERDRNVQVGGWGTDGSGVASTTLRTSRSSYADMKVFRRARIVNAKAGETTFSFLNLRDVFVTARVTAYDGAASTESIVVAGYQTEGDDETRYPIAGFGDNGVVRVQPEAHDESWSSFSSAWTVVSRDLLAVLYDSNDAESGYLAMIEYFDLRTGRLDTTYGSNGRTYIPTSAGMDWVQDFALRAFDNAGKPLFVVVGTKDSNDSVDVIVAGVTTDGTADPALGDDSSGGFSIVGTMPVTPGRQFGSFALADPGVGGPDGAVGVLVSATDDETPDTSLTAMVIAKDTSTGRVTPVSSSSYSVSTTLPGRSFSVRHLAFSGPLTLISQIDTWTPEDGDMSQAVSFARSSVSGSNVNDLFPARDLGGDNISATDGPIVNVSNEREIRVEKFKDFDSMKTFIGICFSRGCDSTGTLRIDLADIDPYENVWTTLGAVVADSSGTNVLLKNRNWMIGETKYSTFALGPSGATAINESEGVPGPFDDHIYDEDGENLVEQVSDAVFLDGSTMVAMRSQYANDRTINQVLLVQPIGGDVNEVKFSYPVGVSSYSSDMNSMTRIDATSVGVVAYVLDSATGQEEKRIYKVSVLNGSIDTSFGTEGYVSMPVTPGDDECGFDERIISTDGVIANLELDYDPLVGSEDGECEYTPAEARWTTFTTTGRPIGSGQSKTPLANLAEWSIDSWSVDVQGNLYVSGGVSVFDETDGFYLGEKTMLARFRPDGSVDQEFGDAATTSIGGVSRNKTAMTLDAAGHVYLGDVVEGDTVAARIIRLTSSGKVDASIEVTPPETVTTMPPATPAERRAAFETTITTTPAQRSEAEPKRSAEATLPADDGLTIIGDMPVLTSVTADQDRSLTATWSTSAAAGKTYVTATAVPGGRSCTSDTGSCVIRGLDPTVTYTVSVAKKGDEATPLARASVAPVKPVVSLKVGKVASPTTFVRPASKGKATWKVRGGCKLNDTKTRVTAPKSPTKCQLSVTTAKFGSTPKTTKSVTIVVKK